MAVLYLTEQGSVLKKTGKRVIVKKEGEKIADIPIIKLDSLLIFGNIQVTTQALKLLFQNGIDLAFFTYYGKLSGMLQPIKSKNIVLRNKHFKKANNNNFGLKIAKKLVKSKIRNIKYMLNNHLKNYHSDKISNVIKDLDKFFPKIDRKNKPKNLLGIEGVASQRYYHIFNKLVRAPFKFHGRSRRPPKDEINSLLSFSYVILTNELSLLLNACGLDPYLGFYHGIQYGRPSLALDLIEPYRPVLDRFVINLLNLKTLSKDDFGNKKSKYYLNKEGRKKYFRAYHQFSEKYRDSYINQIESLKKSIKRESRFQPFLMKDL
ncbi:MAG: CRISPR-associated endonuclease Cas1 [Candidatus Marinimicrobia bacterium]|nr:CRISPR-associated endonuclease Cas1 [Candidatus Neomarinimicrobiota bacterium]